MDNISGDETWALPNSNDNTLELQETAETETEEEDEDETLSFSALPLILKMDEKEENRNRALSQAPMEDQTNEDFDFCSGSKESEMCAADEIFFRGKILPFRMGNVTRYISRSESMDGFYSGYGGLISSRSSSVSSHQLSSSSSGSSSADPNPLPKLPPAQNQFHSHPSPSPRIDYPSKRGTISGNHRNSSAKRSPAWSVFRLGITTAPPEIAFQDLKPRANRRNFRSRNSTESGGSSGSAGSRNNSSRVKKNLGLLGGCKCSGDAVETVRTRVVIIKRSARESEVDAVGLENGERIKPAMAVKKLPARKQSLHHRTSEWLQQLSLEG